MSTQKIVGQELSLPRSARPLSDVVTPPFQGRRWLGETVQSNRPGLLMGLSVLFILGSLILAIIGLTRITSPEEPTFLQEGEVRLAAGGELDVYYAIPFPRTPNLEVNSSASDCVIVEQQADHFRIRNPDPNSAVTAQWKARGLRWSASTQADSPTPEAEHQPRRLPCN
jgi:hypothetical protein